MLTSYHHQLPTNGLYRTPSRTKLATLLAWMWMFTSANEEASLWQDLHGNYWVLDPEDGDKESGEHRGRSPY